MICGTQLQIRESRELTLQDGSMDWLLNLISEKRVGFVYFKVIAMKKRRLYIGGGVS